MKSRLSVAILIGCLVASIALAGGRSGSDGVDPQTAIKALLAGNKHFIKGDSRRANLSPARRKEVAKSQHPIAIVIACSDSRVSPELIFDQGLGDLFVVRDAGNSVDDLAMGSIEYALDHLGSRLIVVIGHERCGAVQAALAGGDLPGHLPSVVAPIKDAVQTTKNVRKDAQLDATVDQHVRDVIRSLQSSDSVKKLLAQKKIAIVGMRYDLDSGAVRTIK